jgi:hypothetical protein
MNKGSSVRPVTRNTTERFICQQSAYTPDTILMSVYIISHEDHERRSMSIHGNRTHSLRQA